jgi:hypothetical protein
MLIQRIHAELLAQVHLRFAILRSVRLKLDHIELQPRQRGAHEVVLVLRLHHEFIVVLTVRPLLLLLRARSGAQINEQEYQRLTKIVPNPNSPDARFLSDLRNFREEVRGVLARRSGAQPLITPRGGGPQPQGQPVPRPALDDADPLGIFN